MEILFKSIFWINLFRFIETVSGGFSETKTDTEIKFTEKNK